MSKSKYPNQLDTSVEIQPVRDNILEVGSDVINSLRSAIFNIERTLGINPQGSVGNTVAERIGRSLDGNGNIKPDALSRANLLTGPIVDNDVSKVAAIKESKLKLDFPTQLLQDEISILNSQISEIISEIENLSTELSIHTNPASLNRHKATAITVEGKTSVGSDISTLDLESGTVQEGFEAIYNSHINYSGVNLAEDNKSHSANQIYFDNTTVSSFITANSVQGAIEELATNPAQDEKLHQGIMHSNGILRAGIITQSDDSVGNVLVDSAIVTFSASTGSSPYYTIITITDTVSIADFNLSKSDILTLFASNGTSPSYVGSYEIIDYTTTGTLLDTVTILANFTENSSSLTRAKISKKIRDNTNLASLLVSIREEAGLTSARSVQVCNPNSVRVISSGIRPYEITTTNRFIEVSIDTASPVTVDLYTPGVRQSVDTIVSKINEQCAEESLFFLSYRLDKESESSEIVLACNIPDVGSSKHTIKVSRSSDSGIDSAGFGYIEDQVISSVYGSSYYILGKEYSGLATKLDSNNLLFSAGSTVVNSGGSGLDFLQLGVREFDILTISGAADSQDDGSYAISSVSSTQLTLSPNQLPAGFSATNQEETNFKIYRNTASFDNITFDVVSPTFGATLLDVFMDQEQNIFTDKRFEWAVNLSAPISLLDFEGEVGNEQFVLNIVQNTDYITASLDNGPEVEVRGTDNYFWIKSGDKNVKLRIFLTDTSSIPLGGLVTTFYGYGAVSNLTNLLLSRVQYNNYIGRVGSRVVNIIPRGNVSSKEISTSAVRNLVSGPRSELRSNGVVSGLEIKNVSGTGDLYTFDIGSGICYINGRRYEISEKLNFITDIDSTVNDKIFIAIDENGNIIVEPTTPSCSVPFESLEVCVLGTVEFSTPNFYVIDLRLFIDNLDLKVLNAITVSPQPGMAHFTDLGKALKYAKRFSQVFPKAGVPTVHLKSGNYEIVNEFDNSGLTYASWLAQSSNTKTDELLTKLAEVGLVLDSPVNVTGEGDSSVLKLRNKYIFSDTQYTFKGEVAIVGAGYTTSIFAGRLEDGLINISNLKMNNSKIVMYDTNVLDGAINLPFEISIDNVSFDNRNFEYSNLIDDDITSIVLKEAYDLVENKGNFCINNSRFIPESTAIGSAIVLASASRTKNVLLTNNKLINSSNNSSLLSQDIVNFSSANNGSNITIIGNIATGSFATTTSVRADIYSGANKWYDRINRSLVVGEDTVSDEFKYPSEKSIFKYYFFGKENNPTEGSIGGATTFLTQNIGSFPDSFKITSVQIPTSDYASLILDNVPFGSTIKSIVLGITFPSSGFVSNTYTVDCTIRKMTVNKATDIYSQTYLNTETTSRTFTASASKIYRFSFDFNHITSDPDDSFYVIKVEHNAAVTVGCAYVLVEYEFTALSDALGII